MKRDGQVQAPQWGALDQAKYDIVTAAKANAKRTLTQFKQKYDSIKCGRVCKAVKNCFKYGFVTYADEIASGHSEKTAEYAAIHACLLATFTTLVFGSDGPRQTPRGGGTSGPIAITRRRFGLAAPALRALAFA